MDPTFQITYKNLETSDALDNYVREQIDRLVRAFARIHSLNVIIDQPHRSQQQGNAFHVGIKIHIPGAEIVVNRNGAKPASEDAYLAVHSAFDEARRKLMEHVDSHFRPRH